MGVFADDLKMYAKIPSIEISLHFQYNIGSELGAKTMQMSLHRKPSPIVDDYTINGVVISRVQEYCDPGGIQDEKLNSSSQLDKIVWNSYSMLGFFKRICFGAVIRKLCPMWAVISKQFVLYALRRSVKRDVEYRLSSYSVSIRTGVAGGGYIHTSPSYSTCYQKLSTPCSCMKIFDL